MFSNTFNPLPNDKQAGKATSSSYSILKEQVSEYSKTDTIGSSDACMEKIAKLESTIEEMNDRLLKMSLGFILMTKVIDDLFDKLSDSDSDVEEVEPINIETPPVKRQRTQQ